MSSPPTQPTEKQPGNNQDTPKQELTVRPREEADGAEAGEETSDDVTAEKETPQLTSEGRSRTAEDVIDVETVSQTGVGDDVQSEEQAEKPPYDGVAPGETNGGMESSDESVDVEDCCQKDKENGRFHGRAAPETLVRLGATGSCNCDQDEDVDVIGASSPAPEPVAISWSEFSDGEGEEEDEDVDIV